MAKHTLCVFCGSSEGKNPRLHESINGLVTLLDDEDWDLVYGGARIGLMGMLADACLAKGIDVTGIMPETLVEREVAHRGLTRLEVVSGMHERKQKMYALSDAFLILPGGFGTLDEAFEIITWKQIGYHAKPIGFWSFEGFFDHLTAHFQQMQDWGLAAGSRKKLFEVYKDLAPLFRYFSS